MNYRRDRIEKMATPYGASPGSFLPRNRSYWETCRETWQLSKRNPLFFFAHRAGRGPKLAAFFDYIESRLKLKNRTQFGPTTINSVSWVEPTKWWQTGEMKYSLFTALLRAGMNYENSVLNALKSDIYIRATLPAVERFLDGYTRFLGGSCRYDYSHDKPTPDMVGWYEMFGVCHFDPKKVLVRPR